MWMHFEGNSDSKI